MEMKSFALIVSKMKAQLRKQPNFQVVIGRAPKLNQSETTHKQTIGLRSV